MHHCMAWSMLGKVLDQFFRDVEWGDLDYSIIDLPPGTGDVALDIHQMLPSSKEIVVTTPHPTAAFVAAVQVRWRCKQIMKF